MTSFKHFRPLAVAACTAAACAAHAQDASVTVYGLLDLGVVKQSGGRGTAIARGNNNRIGFRGSEDLGNGLRATFHLQHRFHPDTGAVERASVFWQGESTVGLASSTWGSVRIGRGLTAWWQKNWAFEPWGASGFNASLNAFQAGTFSADGTNDTAMGSANFSRSPNSVFYNSPTFGGFSAAVSAQVEKDTGVKARNGGVSLNYDQGPLSVMLSGERNTDKDALGFVAASYVIGPVKMMGSYTRIEHDAAGDEDNYVVAASYNFGTGSVRGGYGRRDADTDAWKSSVGYVHPLSKRTSLYADLWRQKSGATGFNSVALGILHSF